MQNLIATAIVAAAILVMVLAGIAARKKMGPFASGRSPASSRSRAGKGLRAGAADELELVAVIAAAIAAASGMGPESFRIVGLRPSSDSIAQRGFNTPLWGHIDRSCLQ
jgi:hypothetical protein